MTSIAAAKFKLSAIKRAHFIGIGGIGISAIARMFLLEGKEVSGSDQAVSPVTEELTKLGAKISFGHSASNIPADVDLVVYTIAIPVDNPELVAAWVLGVPVLSYPEMLGRISADKFTIAIAGTHGKTTTTAMVAKIFLAAGLDPTVIVGSLLKESRSNFIAGKSKYFIVEACEYRRSFLNLSPQILVITNIDNDHLDYYKDLADIKSAFAEMKARVPADGVVITEQDYGEIKADFKLQVPGAHNLKNAQAALAVARAAGIADAVAIKALNEFTGTWRRFEFKGKTKNGALVYDDYAHHPTEIRATIQGAREKFPERRLVIIFQPHLYSRTKLLLTDFAPALAQADQVFLLPIYAAREPLDPSVSSEQLVAEINRVGGQVAMWQGQDLGADTVVITMGAGDVTDLAKGLLA